MTDLIWKAPPTSRRGRDRSPVIDTMVTKLKARPGQWALVVEQAKSANSTAVFRRRGCDVRSAIRVDGGFDIYARWGSAR